MNWENTFGNIHSGPCVVIGNGPSLRDVPLEFLRKFPTFGTNRIYLLRDFVCDYYVSVNPLVIQQSVEEIKAYPAKAKFITADEASSIPGSYPLTITPNRIFSYNPAAYIFEGHTVTFACLQLAFFMGFETVLLVGVDHSYKMDSSPNAETVWQGSDPDHFDPNYFTGTKWKSSTTSSRMPIRRTRASTIASRGSQPGAFPHGAISSGRSVCALPGPEKSVPSS